MSENKRVYRSRTRDELKAALQLFIDRKAVLHVPVDEEHDADCILADGIYELDDLRHELALALKDNANYRATIQRLMWDARLKDAVVEAARKFWNRSTWCPTDIGQAILALDAAQQQPTEPEK